MLIIFLLCHVLGVVISSKLEMAGVDCDDGYMDCSVKEELCRAENYSQLLHMLTHCRQTCRRYFDDKVGTSCKPE